MSINYRSSADYIRIEQSSGKINDFKGKPKFRKKTENVKKGRLVIRNLSFKVTEESLRKAFETYGTISEVNLLKKADGKLVGCAFLQYENYDDSTKAIKAMNGKDFLKRKISVDFAVSKNRYTNTHKSEDDDPVKEENPEPSEVKKEDEIKDEGDKASSSGEEEIKEEKSDDDDDDDAGETEETKVEQKPEIKKEKKYSDSDNEFTVFIKNLSFDTENDDLRECFKKFGPIKYALVVKDHVSGHSKGTGFVRFLRKESVELCRAQSGKIHLQDFVLDVFPTLSKQTVKNIEKQKEESKKEIKDGRNLYLVREGMITAGSTASEGVSATDMSKRLRLEQIKSSMLKNLTRFISRERLTIHNLPENYDDAKLRKMVESKTKIKVSHILINCN
jgi:nucleolar protein 4